MARPIIVNLRLADREVARRKDGTAAMRIRSTPGIRCGCIQVESHPKKETIGIEIRIQFGVLWAIIYGSGVVSHPIAHYATTVYDHMCGTANVYPSALLHSFVAIYIAFGHCQVAPGDGNTATVVCPSAGDVETLQKDVAACDLEDAVSPKPFDIVAVIVAI